MKDFIILIPGFNGSADLAERLKIEVFWLKSQKIPHQKICQLAGISPNTLLTYLRDYQEGGIKKIKRNQLISP